jgi:hypothetical protein
VHEEKTEALIIRQEDLPDWLVKNGALFLQDKTYLIGLLKMEHYFSKTQNTFLHLSNKMLYYGLG